MAADPVDQPLGSGHLRIGEVSAKPFYGLGEKIATMSTSEDKRTLTCSGAISVVVGDTKAPKEVNLLSNAHQMARFPSL
jgi:hypothetical protein